MRNNKLLFSSFIMAALAVQLTGCQNEIRDNTGETETIAETTALVSQKEETTDESLSEYVNKLSNSNTVSLVEYSDKELTYEWSENCTKITASDSGFKADGDGVSVSGTTLNINSAGTYYISGSINDGNIIVNSSDTKAVRLIFGGFDISCTTTAPINVVNADKLIITLENGTENHVSDTARTSSEAENEPTGAIFSKADLSFNGEGKLYVNAQFNDGIVTKDKLKIVSGDIEIISADDGMIGKDLTAVRDGNIKITSAGDGIKATNSTDDQKGNIIVEGGNIDITSANDGMQSENTFIISGGNVNILAGEGSSNGEEHRDNMGGGRFGGFGGNIQNTETSSVSSESKKGIKSVNEITVNGGTININSADDALHSDGSVTVNGGIITLASGDDGIHSENTLDINGGEVVISESYEGLEGAFITINDGNVHLRASDDGVNASSGDMSADVLFTVNGGCLYVDASGDGLDSNGDIIINDGLIIVNGPTSSGDGPLDCGDKNNKIIINGGTLIAAGSSGMFEVPSADSKQNSVATTMLGASAETLCTLADENGNVIAAFKPAKNAAAIVISSPDIKTGNTYKLYTDGTYSGILSEEGYAKGGSITGGTENASFEISSAVTTVGNIMSGGFGGGGRKNFSDSEMPNGEFGGKMPFGDGEMPEMPDGESGGRMPFGDGEMPEMPDGEFGGRMPFGDGEMPEMPDGEFGGKNPFGDGEMPEGSFKKHQNREQTESSIEGSQL